MNLRIARCDDAFSGLIWKPEEHPRGLLPRLRSRNKIPFPLGSFLCNHLFHCSNAQGNCFLEKFPSVLLPRGIGSSAATEDMSQHNSSMSLYTALCLHLSHEAGVDTGSSKPAGLDADRNKAIEHALVGKIQPSPE